MTEDGSQCTISVTKSPVGNGSNGRETTTKAAMPKYPMTAAERKRKKYRRVLFVCVLVVVVALGATFALFGALGLLSNENGFLSSKSRLPDGMSGENGSQSTNGGASGNTGDEDWDWSRSLIVVSIDGFHPSYLIKTNANHLRRFGKNILFIFYLIYF